jgi:hypothetical protein
MKPFLLALLISCGDYSPPESDCPPNGYASDDGIHFWIPSDDGGWVHQWERCLPEGAIVVPAPCVRFCWSCGCLNPNE